MNWFMAAALLISMVDTGRLARISRNAASRIKIARAVPLMIDYVVGGWMALRKTKVETRANRPLVAGSTARRR